MDPSAHSHAPLPIPSGALPDAETDERIYLVKNVPLLRATQQILLLSAKAALLHKQLILMTPAACRLDKTLEELMRSRPGIIRREDLR